MRDNSLVTEESRTRSKPKIRNELVEPYYRPIANQPDASGLVWGGEDYYEIPPMLVLIKTRKKTSHEPVTAVKEQPAGSGHASYDITSLRGVNQAYNSPTPLFKNANFNKPVEVEPD